MSSWFDSSVGGLATRRKRGAQCGADLSMVVRRHGLRLVTEPITSGKHPGALLIGDMIDLTLDAPQDGTWRVETADGVFEYAPSSYACARARYNLRRWSPWARLLKLVGKGTPWEHYRLVSQRGEGAPTTGPSVPMCVQGAAGAPGVRPPLMG